MALQSRFLLKAIAGLVTVSVSASAGVAQQIQGNVVTADVPSSQGEGLREIGRTAQTSVGEVGQRRTSANSGLRTEPTGRVKSRIQNRVQNRVNNRIDRNYDPRNDVTSSFERASDKAP